MNDEAVHAPAEVAGSARYPRYPVYDSTNVGWMIEKPAHWKEFRSKILFQKMERSPREEDDVVTAFRDGTVTLRKNRRTEGFTNSIQEIGYQGVRKGDLVIHAMDAFAGAIGISDSDGKSTPVYSVCTPKRSDIYTLYYARLLRHMALTGFITSLAKGIRERSTEFRYKEFAELVVPFPPLAEQRAIAAFLDRETARIDTLIARQAALIALLQEKRKALISHAVTKGLDAAAPMKDSGVAWLGAVPAHWVILPLKLSVLEIVDCKNRTPPYYVDGKYLVVRTSNVRNGKLDLEEASYTNEEGFQEWTKRGIPQEGDVLFTREAPMGEACIVPKDLCLCLGQRMMYIRPDPESLSNYFLLYSIYSSIIEEYIKTASAGSIVAHLKVGQVYSMPTIIPPISEQALIVETLNNETSKLDTLIAKAEQFIELLREHRSSLIAAAVTGAIDVRGLAAAEAR